jgi:hypothetical protein
MEWAQEGVREWLVVTAGLMQQTLPLAPRTLYVRAQKEVVSGVAQPVALAERLEVVWVLQKIVVVAAG